MTLYSYEELLLIVAAAIAIDWIVGDPKWPTHPVILIGRWIARMERALKRERYQGRPVAGRALGIALAASTLLVCWSVMWGLVRAADAVHPWLGYAVSAWFVSTTIAVKGLKQAAMLVYVPLAEGRLQEARKYVGYIVSRDTTGLDEQEAARAAVETVAENTVDAFVSPVLFALLGGAPLAMLYRAANTLDSMVGYRNERYRYFGWCSARVDDVLNFIPARITGLLLTLVAWLAPGLRAGRCLRAVIAFAHKHPSPNSGYPEAAVAGALGIELGGTNVYFGVAGERARMGWPTRAIAAGDIKRAVFMLYGVSVIVMTGVIIAWFFLS